MQRGQAINTGLVWGIVLMLVAVAIGGLVFSKIHAETEKQTKGTGTTYTWDNTLSGTGTLWLYDVKYHDELKSATTKADYDFSDTVVLTIKVNSNTIVDQSYAAGTGTVESDVIDYVTEGNDNCEVSVDNSARVTSLSTDFNVQSYEKSVGEGVATDVGSGAKSIFPLLVLIIIIGVFVALIAVLRVLG